MLSRAEVSLPTLLFGLVSVTWMGLFGLQLTRPPDLMDNGQERPAAYVLDVLRNGNWICQRDHEGNISSKPPLYTWLVVLVTLPFERISLFTLYLPCALAMLGIVWLLLAIGSVKFDLWSGFLAAMVYLVSATGAKQICLARTDTLFALTVFVAALCCYRAWIKGSGWTWFWLAAAAATLTKGPLGLLLSAGGLLALFWERRSGKPVPLRGKHWPGISLYVLIVGGWFGLAYWQMGQALVDKMISQELIGHALRNSAGVVPGEVLYKPTLYFLSRFFPWSLFACVGLWRLWKHPSREDTVRRFERFMVCYFLFGMAVLSLSPHQRPDHLFPLLPAAALLAGRELTQYVRTEKLPRLFLRIAAGLTAVLLLAIAYYYGVRARQEPVVRTNEMRNLARFLQRKVGSEFPLVHVDSPFTLQFYLNTMRPHVSSKRAAELLDGSEAAFVVVQKREPLEQYMEKNRHSLYEVTRWPQHGVPHLRVVSNHARLEYTDQMASMIGPDRVPRVSALLPKAAAVGFLALVLCLAGRKTLLLVSSSAVIKRAATPFETIVATPERLGQPVRDTSFNVRQTPVSGEFVRNAP